MRARFAVVCADLPQFSLKYRFSRVYRFVYAEWPLRPAGSDHRAVPALE
jgi:hypothetical protein